MEAIRSMVSCFFTGGRRLSNKSLGYTEITDEKALLNYFSDKSPSTGTADMPYMSSNSMAYYGTICHPDHPDYAHSRSSHHHRQPTDEQLAEDVVRLLRRAEWNDSTLQQRVRAVVGDASWSRKMVEECLDNMIECVEDGRRYMGDAMCEALDKATDVADDEFKFPRRHAQSVDGFIAIVAIGILAQMQGPWVLDVLGFGEVEDRVDLVDEDSGEEELSMSASSKIVPYLTARPGSVAAWWSREFAAYIPRGSVYEYFRGLGMVRTSEDYQDDDVEEVY